MVPTFMMMIHEAARSTNAQFHWLTFPSFFLRWGFNFYLCSTLWTPPFDVFLPFALTWSRSRSRTMNSFAGIWITLITAKGNRSRWTNMCMRRRAEKKFKCTFFQPMSAFTQKEKNAGKTFSFHSLRRWNWFLSFPRSSRAPSTKNSVNGRWQENQFLALNPNYRESIARA